MSRRTKRNQLGFKALFKIVLTSKLLKYKFFSSSPAIKSSFILERLMYMRSWTFFQIS